MSKHTKNDEGGRQENRRKYDKNYKKSDSQAPKMKYS